MLLVVNIAHGKELTQPKHDQHEQTDRDSGSTSESELISSGFIFSSSKFKPSARIRLEITANRSRLWSLELFVYFLGVESINE